MAHFHFASSLLHLT